MPGNTTGAYTVCSALFKGCIKKGDMTEELGICCTVCYEGKSGKGYRQGYTLCSAERIQEEERKWGNWEHANFQFPS